MKKLGLLSFALLQPAVLFSQPISEELALDVGGNNIYLEIAGPSVDAPLILYLHGGPANVALGIPPFRADVGRQLEDSFLVAYMHQRSAGKSSQVPASEMTIAAHIDDIAKVVDFLSGRYDQGRVHLLAHSLGGVQALLYADRHRERVDKLILVASVVNMRATYRDSYEVVAAWAEEEGNSVAVEQLSAVSPQVETPQDAMTVTRWANQANGGIDRSFDFAELLERHNVLTEYPNWSEQQSNAMQAMGAEIAQIDLTAAISTFDVPALFISGAYDSIVPEITMRRDYDNYGGEKEFVLLENSHHLPFIDQPDEMVDAIRFFLLD